MLERSFWTIDRLRSHLISEITLGNVTKKNPKNGCHMLQINQGKFASPVSSEPFIFSHYTSSYWIDPARDHIVAEFRDKHDIFFWVTKDRSKQVMCHRPFVTLTTCQRFGNELFCGARQLSCLATSNRPGFTTLRNRNLALIQSIVLFLWCSEYGKHENSMSHPKFIQLAVSSGSRMKYQ